MSAVLQTAPGAAPQAIDEQIRELTAAISKVELERTVRDLTAFGTRHVLSTTDRLDRGTGAARQYLEARLVEISIESEGRMRVESLVSKANARRLREPELRLVNVVATLRGTTDPGRVYVVGGHYDSRNSAGADGEGDAPGANDDGSGTAVVIELARIMATSSFPATIKFVCYDGEEQGLLGSSAHAAALAESDLVIDGMITNDIVGNTLGMDGVRRRDYLRCFSYAPRGNDSVGRSLARAATRAGDRVDGLRARLVFRGDRYGRGGDHRPFAQRGIPAVRFTEPREDFSRQHKNVVERDGKPYADLPEFMDFEYLADVARLNASLLVELASAPRPPVRVRVRGARASYDTVVEWTPGEGVDSAFEIVWRDTTAPDWEHARELSSEDVGRGVSKRATLEGVCLDEVVVGVRAVSVDGARSRVTTPPEPDALGNRPVSRRRKRK